MNIILLSGGSGKRLWPLSNDVRSKQFIPFFQRKDGKMQSMVQKMYQQIKKIDKDAIVTLATSKAQASEIRNQLGDDVNISIEPERKDTFPAIALACSYLHDVKKVGLEEPIIVCPVDPYVEEDYFLSLKEMEKIIRSKRSKLILMGIEPTSPSEKFGYIIPKSKAKLSYVSTFKEKPDLETAKKYLKKHALWNAGIFGFECGYVLSRAHEIIDFKDYDDLYEKYDSLNKISFDYAVSEQEESISVLRFKGKWDDLGTWPALIKVIDGESLGKVVSEKNKNTKIINELDIPIVALGMKNAIIAASPDGILVSSIDKSSSIKPIAEELDNGTVRYAEKSWGKYTVIDVSRNSMTISIHLTKYHKMSYHSHSHRNEIWNIVSGKGEVILDGKKKKVFPGDVIPIKEGVKHTISALTDMKIIEVQIGKDIDVKDKQKFELE